MIRSVPFRLCRYPGFVHISVAFASYMASQRAAEDYCNEVVDGEGRLLEVDSIGSVSAVERNGTEMRLCLL